jgi:transcription termination factor Rho
MPEELTAEAAEAAETKPKRKAPAKKVAAKKAAATKVAAKKAAPVKAARKTAKKKAVEPEAELPLMDAAAPVEAEKPVEAAPVAAVPEIVEVAAPVVVETAQPAAPSVATEAAPGVETDGEGDAEGSEASEASAEGDSSTPRNMIMDANGQLRPMTAKERRKMKFERWKQRRAERDAQRRGERGGERPERGGEGPRSQEPRPQFTQEREPEPEKPLGPPEPANGILEMSPKGYGFLRQRDRNYAQHPLDAFIAPEFIRKYGLREGMQVVGVQCKGQRGPQITEVSEVNGRNPFVMRDLPLFEELKAVNPNKRYQLETVKDRLTTRVIDMMAPVGRGQRGLIVAPPRAGKTTMLQHIAEAVVENHPGVHLMILLVDERPEEVTEFKRILPQAEIFASNNDQDVKSHTRIAAFAIERAKRLVECGEHVFMLMDSITRMARAFNNTAKSGATMSGGVGVGALEVPRRLFAAARNTRTAGSLTILGTALIETGSRMDDLIFQEFKGTGNMELVLDRRIAEQFVFPAVNIFKSGTRREELLLQAFQLDKIHMLRRGLAGHKPIEAIQRVISLLERYPSNAQMLVDLPSKS